MDAAEDDLKDFNDAANKTRDLLEQNEGEKDDLDSTQEDTNEKFKKVREALADRQATLEDVADKAKKLNDSLNDIGKTTNDVEKEFQPKFEEPIPKDVAQIQKAIAEVDEALQKLADPVEELQKDKQLGDWFIEQSKHDPNTTRGVESRLDTTQEPLDKTIEKLNDYKSKLVSAQHDQQAQDEKVDSLADHLHKLEPLVADLKPVSALFNVGRVQQEELKVKIGSFSLASS